MIRHGSNKQRCNVQQDNAEPTQNGQMHKCCFSYRTSIGDGTERGSVYLVSSRRKVIKSFRSLGFFNPPKAILVPGIYFFGFSRYSNCAASVRSPLAKRALDQAYKRIFCPMDALLFVCVGVREAFDLTSLSAEQTV